MQIDVENVFNNISQIAILRKLWDAKGPLASIIPFTIFYYGVQFSFYYQHKEHKEKVTIIESSSNTSKVTPYEAFYLP
jgi:hypothetical protein